MGVRIMKPASINVAAFALAVLAAILFEVGVLRAGDAFFVVAVLGVSLTGYHLMRREGQPLIEVAQEILTRPGAHAGRRAYGAYLGALALALFIATQTVVA